MTEPYTPRRPRFSLLGLIGLTTIIAMAIAVWQLYAEVVPLRQENRRLRDEVGELSIDDETKLHAIRVPTDAERTWKWRVWIPKGRAAVVHFHWGDISLTGLPNTKMSMQLDSGEQLLTLSAKPTEAGSWLGQVQTGRQGATVEAPSECFASLTTSITQLAGMNNTEVAVSSPFVLGRYRVAGKGKHDLLNQDVPMPGFIIWIDWIP